MRLIGKTLGHYEILEPLGAGGMGEVYLAQDPRLGRKVAIKVLPVAFASDPERLARFEQEARAAAALNHPHIAIVHDVGFEPDEAGSTIHFMVQEYLEGETLREPLKKGPLPLKKALAVAADIAKGLAAAHRAGVLHRDLKPENVFITHDAHAKILDFGLAKLTETGPIMSADAQPSMSPTVLGTVAGQVMGTAGYMAPEQVQGDGDVDQRADLFSFGCLIYEMVGGRQPFAGRSVMQTLDLIVNEEPPDLTETMGELPAQLQWILRKALAKDPADRYQHADDLLVDLRLLAKDVEAGAAATAGAGGLPAAASSAAAAETEQRASLPLKVAVPVGVVVVAMAALAGWLLGPSGAEAPAPARFEIGLPEGTILPSGVGRDLAVSPDGRVIVYVAQSSAASQLYVRPVDQLVSTPLAGTEGAQEPFFSPDGEWVAFSRGSGLHRVSLAGGDPFALCTECGAGPGSWTRQGIIVVVRDGGLWTIPEVGGDPRLLLQPTFDGEALTARRISVLPGERAVLFESGIAGNARGVYVVSLDTEEVVPLAADGSDPRWSDSGHVLFPRGDTLFAVGFDVERLEATSQPFPVLQDVRVEGGGALQAVVSSTGVLAYAPSGNLVGSALVWVDRAGGEQLALSERRSFRAPRISPDGERIAVEVADAAGSDIWVLDTGPGTFQRLTTTTTVQYPLWTPDGESLAFSEERGGLLRLLAADGSGATRILLGDQPTSFLAAESWTPDGARLVVREATGAAMDLSILVAEGGELTSLIATPEFNEVAASLSRDGRWLTYVSDRSGQREVYVRPFPGPGGEQLVSIAGGTEPAWSPDDSEIFYRAGSRFVAVSVQTEPDFRITGRGELFDVSRYLSPTPTRTHYDVHPDGERFLMIRQEGEGGSRPGINVVLNWFEELRQTVPTGER